VKKSLADKIEQYLKVLIDRSEGKQIEIQRAELAETFSCVPSQVTYVISTRFQEKFGYRTESRRGGKGFVRITRLAVTSDVFFEKYKRNFRIKSFFIGDTNRDAINKGDADYTPVFTSRIPNLFERKVFPIDIALVQVSPPDEHGYFNLGVGVDITKAAVENAGLVIAQVNSYMPRVHGDGFIHINDIDYIIPYDEPLPEYDFGKESEIALQVGRYVASLVRDGDTLQIGYGHIPLGVLSCLSHKRHLGIHTDLITDAIVDLIKKGVIDNSKKSINKGKTIGTYCLGSKQTYDFVNNNPSIELRRIDYVDNPMTIARHNKMTAINTVLQMDLTGQASAETLAIGNGYNIGGNVS
jgi:acyl-CoA hydrolase